MSKYVMFQNESGDDPYPICSITGDIPKELVTQVCQHFIGDNFDGEFVYGRFWVEDFGQVESFETLRKIAGY